MTEGAEFLAYSNIDSSFYSASPTNFDRNVYELTK